MPGVFYTSCRKCGASIAETTWYDSLLRDGVEIPLPHPGESVELEKFGLTTEKAARAGMLHRFEAYGCRKCGAVSYVKTLALPTELTGVFCLLVLIALGGFAAFISRNPWGCALVAAAVLLPSVKLDRYLNRLRARKKHGFNVDTSCKSCGSSDTVEIGHLLVHENASLLCTACGERQRVLDRVALS